MAGNHMGIPRGQVRQGAGGRQLVRKEGEQAMGKEQPVNGQRCQDSGGGEAAGEGQRATSKTPQLRQPAEGGTGVRAVRRGLA